MTVNDQSHSVLFSIKNKETNFRSFPDGYHFNTKKFDAIQNNTILTIDIKTGEIINQWGNNRFVSNSFDIEIKFHFSFYMPHGLFVDNEENIWLTDVAMHQVNLFSFFVN
jgi:hypothetical protein